MAIQVVLQAQSKENCGFGKVWFRYLPSSFKTAFSALPALKAYPPPYLSRSYSLQNSSKPSPEYVLGRELAFVDHMLCARNFPVLSHFIAPEKIGSYLLKKRLYLYSYEEFKDSKLFRSIYSFIHFFIYSFLKNFIGV